MAIRCMEHLLVRLNSENLMFTTKVKSFSNEVSPLKESSICD